MKIENEACKKILEQVNQVVIGKEQIAAKLLAALLAGGHVLLTDIPGVGKTTLAMAFSRSCELDQKRMQFTPDVLPSDVTGFSLWSRETNQMVYQPGAVMCHLFLADEINRTSSKTQSALLEAMEERQVTVDGVTRRLPDPFMVIATQNPVGTVGTQRLPESQIDRFMVGMTMGYPAPAEEIQILKKRNSGNPLASLTPVVSREELMAMKKQVSGIYVHEDIYAYLVELVSKTRSHQEIEEGVSPRGSLALLEMAKAVAFLSGYEFVIPEHVQEIFLDVCGHRIRPRAHTTGLRTASASADSSHSLFASAEEAVLQEILASVKAPAIR